MALNGDSSDAPTPPARGGGDLLMVAAAVFLAYRFGKAAGARSKLPVPSAASIAFGYFGLRAMDRVFGGLTK